MKIIGLASVAPRMSRAKLEGIFWSSFYKHFHRESYVLSLLLSIVTGNNVVCMFDIRSFRGRSFCARTLYNRINWDMIFTKFGRTFVGHILER